MFMNLSKNDVFFVYIRKFLWIKESQRKILRTEFSRNILKKKKYCFGLGFYSVNTSCFGKVGIWFKPLALQFIHRLMCDLRITMQISWMAFFSVFESVYFVQWTHLCVSKWVCISIWVSISLFFLPACRDDFILNEVYKEVRMAPDI